MNGNGERVTSFYHPRYDFQVKQTNNQANNTLYQRRQDYQTTKSYNLPVINNTGKYFVNQQPKEDRYKITEMNYGVTSNPYVTDHNYTMTPNLYTTYPKQQNNPSIYQKQQTRATVYQKRDTRQPSVYQNQRRYNRTVNSQHLSTKKTRKSKDKKAIKNDKPEQPELLYKMSLPCAKNCCYCVFTTCLGPVKLFVSQQGKLKKEDSLPAIDTSKKKVNNKKTKHVPINSIQRPTQKGKNR